MCTVEHEAIKRTAEEFSRQNGNTGISNKEMLIYLMHRQDDMLIQHQVLLDVRSKQLEHCTANFMSRKTFFLVNGIMMTLLGGLFVIIAKHLQIW